MPVLFWYFSWIGYRYIYIWISVVHYKGIWADTNKCLWFTTDSDNLCAIIYMRPKFDIIKMYISLPFSTFLYYQNIYISSEFLTATFLNASFVFWVCLKCLTFPVNYHNSSVIFLRRNITKSLDRLFFLQNTHMLLSKGVLLILLWFVFDEISNRWLSSVRFLV